MWLYFWRRMNCLEVLVRNVTSLVPSVPIRAYIYTVHECSKFGASVEVHLGGLNVLMIIDDSFEVPRFGSFYRLRCDIVTEIAPKRAKRANMLRYQC